MTLTAISGLKRWRAGLTQTSYRIIWSIRAEIKVRYLSVKAQRAFQNLHQRNNVMTVTLTTIVDFIFVKPLFHEILTIYLEIQLVAHRVALDVGGNASVQPC